MKAAALHPRATFSADAADAASATPPASAASPPPTRRRARPGWKPTLVRAETFARLRAIQKSTVDPVLDLSYLSEACLRLALELGPEAIVRRALADLGRGPPHP